MWRRMAPWQCAAVILLLVGAYSAYAAEPAFQPDRPPGDTPYSPDSDGGDMKDPTTKKPLSEHNFLLQQNVANNITVAGLTLYVWEYVAMLPGELKMYRRKMLARPQVLLFLLIRYGTVPALVVNAYAFYGNFNGRECPKHEQVTVAVVQFLLSCIFSWRTVAIWRRERWIVVFLVVLTFVVFATNTGLLYHAADLRIRGGRCRPGIPDGKPNTVPWFYLTSMVFDIVTMVLSTYKLIVYANMGRIQAHPHPVFRDPFSRRSVQAEESAAESPDGRRGSLASRYTEPLRRGFHYLAMPVHLCSRWVQSAQSFTPLLTRLLYNGLVYFVVATAFNIVNFILELVHSIHSKSLLPLYAPLMCVLCQRMLLIELDAVWPSLNTDLGLPGLQLVDNVVSSDQRRPRPSETNRLTELLDTLERNSWARRSGAENAAERDVEKSLPPSAVPQGKPDMQRSSTPSPTRSTPSEDPVVSPRGTPAPAAAPLANSLLRSSFTSEESSLQAAVASKEPLPTLSPEQQQRALRMAGM